MATVNAKYEFMMVDVGDFGRLSDGSVFSSSHLDHAINSYTLNLPPPRKLGNDTTLYPYVFVGEDAFPLKPCLIKPYPRENISIEERIYNYRISRARRIVENGFGIATSRFRVFHRPMCENVDTTVAVTKAVIAVHNLLMYGRNFDSRSRYCPPDLVDRDKTGTIQRGSWCDEAFNQALVKISNTSSNNYSQLA